MKLKMGLIVNPVAGVGGSAGLKGSDGELIQTEAIRRGASYRAVERAKRFLKILDAKKQSIDFLSWRGLMGATIFSDCGFEHHPACDVSGESYHTVASTAKDTQLAAQAMLEAGADLIVFVGGDGTARDIFDALGDRCPILGIPSGVKMHSGVFAISPEAGGEIILGLVEHGLVNLVKREVRDIDESALREGRIGSHFYGELDVPEVTGFLQRVKSSGREPEELVIQDIAAEIVEKMQAEALYLIGPGSTTEGIMEELGLANTLLGVDAVVDGKLLACDLAEKEILTLLKQYSQSSYMVITVIGGQGYILGRGNQQFSPEVIRKVGLDHICIVATKRKITALEGRPLLVDSNDSALDQTFTGYRRVITGYGDTIMYPVGSAVVGAPAAKR